jgi:hypothetical protein
MLKYIKNMQVEWNKCEVVVIYKAALLGKSKEHFRRYNNMIDEIIKQILVSVYRQLKGGCA